MDSPLVVDSPVSCSSLLFRVCRNGWLEKKRWNKVLFSRLLLCLSLLFIYFFRRHFYCLFGFLNCYLTWPFSSPVHVRLDLSNLSSLIDSSSSSSSVWIPRRLHHILLGELSVSPPLTWLLARNSCLSVHSSFSEHYLWTDETGGRFLSENYSWFLPTWDSYRTDIQKADALRYFVLYHYGGIFLDMDLFCRQSLEGLLNYLDARVDPQSNSMFFGVKAFPVGISNGFLICTRLHPLLRHVLENLELYNRNFLIPHATIVISTGPMCLSIQIQLNRSLWSSILVLDGQENMLGGKTDTPLFKHLGSGSWHQADERFFKNIPMNIQHQSQTFSISIIVLILFLLLLLINKQKTNIKMVHLSRPPAEDSLQLLDSSPLVGLSFSRHLWFVFRSVRRYSLCSFVRNILLFDLLLYMFFLFRPLSDLESFVPVGVRQTKRFLLVVAHPDDECLFFGPTLIGLISGGHEGHLLVFSQGNYEGLGNIRQRELNESCQVLGISLSRCRSMNRRELLDDPEHWWPEDLLVRLIGEYLKEHSIDLLISFDRGGISGHLNHRSLSVALNSPSLRGTNSSLLIYSLTSVSPLFKFVSLFDLLPTLFVYLPRLFQNLFVSPSSCRLLFVNSPWEYLQTVRSFHRHRSQQRWFRHLYTLFSRYMFINDLQLVSSKSR